MSFSGIGGIVAATLMASAVISFVTGTHTHWFFVLGGIGVGLMAVRSIRK